MTTYNLTAGNTGTLTAHFFPTLDGSGPEALTPAVATFTSSDPTVLALGANSAPHAVPYNALKGGTVDVTIAIPAATDATHSYSAFTGSVTVDVLLQTIVIQSFTVVVA